MWMLSLLHVFELGDDVTSGLLADITMTMVTMAAGHGQVSSLGSWMTS